MIKKNLTRLLAALLAAVLLAALPGCGGDEDTVMRFGDDAISTGMYKYWLSTYKAAFLDSYNNGGDDDAFWESEIASETGTITYEEYISGWVFDEVSRVLVSLGLFNEYKLELSEEKIGQIDEDIDEKMKYVGSRSAMNKELGEFGMNIDTYRELKIFEAKSELLYDYLYGTKGTQAPDATELNAYFNENYKTIRFVTIYSGSRIETDDAGNYVYNDDGSLSMTELTQEERQLKAQMIENVRTALENGESYDECAEFSEVDYSDYESGLFVSSNDYRIYGAGVVRAALEMEQGDVEVVDDGTTAHIMLCCENPDLTGLGEAYSDTITTIYDCCVREKYLEKFDALTADVEVNEEALALCDIRALKQNSYY